MFRETVRAMAFRGDDDTGEELSEEVLGIAMPLAVLFLLFVKRDEEGACLADRWEAEDWAGLRNDERVMARCRKGSRATIVEVQRVLDHQAMEWRDLLEPERPPFLVFDRNTAARARRFDKYFGWMTHYPHFSRPEYSAVELSDFVFEEFKEEIELEHAEFLAEREEASPGTEEYTLKDFLSERFGRYCDLVYHLAGEKRRAMLNAMDVHLCVARYEITGERSQLEDILEQHPDFGYEDQDPREQDPEDTIYYTWYRRGESKKVEEGMYPGFRHDQESDGVGVLGQVRLYGEAMEVEAFSKEKYEFAKEMVEKKFGEALRLSSESVVDLAKQLAESSDEEFAEKAPVTQRTLPIEVEQRVMGEFYRRHYEKFLDGEIPALDHLTPRQAARDPSARLRLVELMKTHINGMERLLKERGIEISLDWVLDELGLEELK